MKLSILVTVTYRVNMGGIDCLPCQHFVNLSYRVSSAFIFIFVLLLESIYHI